jgi:hypothetical protein
VYFGNAFHDLPTPFLTSLQGSWLTGLSSTNYDIEYIALCRELKQKLIDEMAVVIRDDTDEGSNPRSSVERTKDVEDA